MAKKKQCNILKELTNAFGAPSIRICTEYHIQVKNGDRSGWHDIWISKDCLKFKLHGKRKISVSHSIKEVIHRLDNFHSSRSDLAAMNEALKIGEGIQHAHIVLLDRNLDEAVFVDGGWKNGKAKIAAIRVTKNGDTDVQIRVISANSSGDTELQAVLLGMNMRSSSEVPIFSDCKSAIESKSGTIKNLHWIPRNRNKGADHLSNVRGQST